MRKMKSRIFGCIKCGKQIGAPKNSKVICTACGRMMWDMSHIKDEEIIRMEMILNFEEYLKDES